MHAAAQWVASGLGGQRGDNARRQSLTDSIRAACLIAGFTCLQACLGGDLPDTEPGPWADVVFKNGDVYTVDGVRSWADAVAVKGDKIVYVGSDSGVDAWIGPGTRTVDLNGKMMLPGFQDAHVHPPWGGVAYAGCPLFEYTALENLLVAVRDCVAADPEAPYVRGEGWTVTLFENGIPHKKLLDDIDSTRPMYFQSSDGHSLWVNSKALEVMGITRETPDPQGGRIDRDGETGESIGVLQDDSAIQMAWRKTPYTDDEIERGLRYATEYLNSLGITAVQDAIVKIEGNDPYTSLEAYRRVNESGDLTLRSVLALFWDVNKGSEQIAGFIEARNEYSHGAVRASSVKIWLDGVVETRTAALLEPYLDGTNTEPYISQENLNQAVAELDKQGFQVHVHGIGDAATRYALNAFEYTREKNGIRDSRHHICHLQLVDPADIPRFRELDVVANFQPLWALPDAYITELTVPRLGPERSRWLYPIGSVLKAGGMIAFGSDWYVTTPNPFPQIETAVTRQDASGEVEGVLEPLERIGLHDAISAFTINAAFVNFQDDTTGSIEVGKIADLIVVDRNLFSIDPREISETKVELTLFGGRVVHGDLDDLDPLAH
jgi:predicted amidohydrolase YtcJ